MVPYVKKSFRKHYIDGLKYIGGWKSIDDDPEKYLGFKFEMANEECKKYDIEVYEYAMDMTERELTQAAEGLFHNLNTLQSRSGNQLN